MRSLAASDHESAERHECRAAAVLGGRQGVRQSMIARTCDDETSDSAVLVGEPEVAIRSDGLVVAQFDVEEPDSNQVSFRRNLVRYADESLAILVGAQDVGEVARLRC